MKWSAAAWREIKSLVLSNCWRPTGPLDTANLSDISTEPDTTHVELITLIQTLNVANPMSGNDFINSIEEAVTHALLSDAGILEVAQTFDQDNEQEEAECINDELPELSEEGKITAFAQVSDS
jgi:hypothetical protein